MPGQGLRYPGGWGSQISRQSAPEGSQVVSPRHRPPLLAGNNPDTHFCQRLSRPQSRSVAGEIVKENYNDIIGNRTRNLPPCSAVPQSTALPPATNQWLTNSNSCTVYIYIYIYIYVYEVCLRSFHNFRTHPQRLPKQDLHIASSSILQCLPPP